MSLVLNRYRRDALIGSGGMGEVYRGVDTATGAPVALKRVPIPHGSARQRARREVDALRVARVPGVVELYDEGEDGDAAWLVMALVEGRPFPNVPSGDADALARVAVRLLEVLDRVHRLGLVHRDIKPSNVLVDDQGRVTVLDFGIARGEALGRTITATDAVLGTPRYLAPEQCLGNRVDGRADLYAAGVMLYEAAAAAPMFEADSPMALLTARTLRAAPPLLDRAPGLPTWLAEAIERLVEREPSARPASAEDALRLFRPEGQRPLPWLGPVGLLDSVAVRLSRGEKVTVRAARGAGSTRFAAEIADRLAPGPVLRPGPAARPFASVRDVLPELPADADPVRIEAALCARLAAGSVVICDDVRRLDSWSRQLLSRLDGPLVLLGVVTADVELPPLSAADLEPLFHGPSRVWHLPEDAARLLHTRTAGSPVRVVRELATWIGAGHATWDGTRLRVERSGLDAIATSMTPLHLPDARVAPEPVLGDLLAWILLAGDAADRAVVQRAMGLPAWEFEAELAELLARELVAEDAGGRLRALGRPSQLDAWTLELRAQAHLAIAEALPPGHRERVFHFVAAGEEIGLAQEVLRQASTDAAPGRRHALAGMAIARLDDRTITHSLRRGAPAGDPGAADTAELRRALAEAITQAALEDGSASALAVAQRELARGGVAEGDPLSRLLRGVELSVTGDPRGGAELVATLPVFDRAEIDAWRQLLPIRARLTDPDVERLIAAVGHPKDSSGFFSRRRREWLARARGLTRRLDEAAALHGSVAAEEQDPRRRLTAWINTAIVNRDAGRLEEALGAFTPAIELAAELRMPAMEAYARCGERVARYRLPEDLAPDPELVGAIERVGDSSLSGVALLTEAAVHWRADAPGAAQEHATRAVDAFTSIRSHTGLCLAQALRYATGGPLADTLVADALAGPDELLSQVAALLVWGGCDDLRDVGILAVRRLPDPAGLARAGVLAPGEAGGILGG